MAKGSQFERDICRELSIWWTQGERDDIFWRTSGSGARATTRAKKGDATANSAGDIGYLDEIGKPFLDYFMVELKRGYTNTKKFSKKKVIEYIKKNYPNPLNPVSMATLFGKMISNTKGGYHLGGLDLIDSKGNILLLEWWEKAEYECIQAGSQFPLIIFKRDGKKSCIVLDAFVAERLITYSPKHLRYINLKKQINIIIMEFESFIIGIDPKDILALPWRPKND